MASYLDKKLRAFKLPDDPCELPLNCKSLFHMKTYQSATDPRAWANESFDRKQYILEMFSADWPREPPQINTMGCYNGKFVDTNSLVKALLSNKDADINRLQSQLSILEQFIEKTDLSCEQRETFEALKGQSKNLLIPSLQNGEIYAERGIKTSYISNMSNLSNKEGDTVRKLFKRAEEQRKEFQYQENYTRSTTEKLPSIEQMASEIDDLKIENSQLRNSLEYVRKEKESCNIDKFLRDKIRDLQKQIMQIEARKYANLTITFNDIITIRPSQPTTTMNNMSTLTSESYMGITEIIEERSVLQGTVKNLISQIDNLQNKSSTQKQPSSEKGNEFSCGDQASQHSQTPPNLHVESNLRNEIKHLREKLNDFKMKNLEFDRLRLRVSELQVLEKEHDEMKVKYNMKFMECRASIMQNLNKIDLLNQKCECLNAELERYHMFENENDILSERCRHLQTMIDHQKQNKELTMESETKINELKEQLFQKSHIIKISEDKLIALQKQLRDSIECLTCETAELKKRLEEANTHIDDLLSQRNMNERTIAQLRDELCAKEMLLRTADQEKQLKPAPKVQQDRENTIEQLRCKLYDLERDNNLISEMTCNLQKYVLHHKTSSTNGVTVCCNVQCNQCNKGINCLIRQLCEDIKQKRMRRDSTTLNQFQNRFKEIQLLVKEQVQWMANELRKCKNLVRSFETQVH